MGSLWQRQWEQGDGETGLMGLHWLGQVGPVVDAGVSISTHVGRREMGIPTGVL